MRGVDEQHLQVRFLGQDIIHKQHSSFQNRLFGESTGHSERVRAKPQARAEEKKNRQRK